LENLELHREGRGILGAKDGISDLHQLTFEDRLADPSEIGLIQLCPNRKDANECPAHGGRRVNRFFHAGELLAMSTQLVNLFVELPDVATDEILNDGVALWALGTDGLPTVNELDEIRTEVQIR